MSAKSTGSDFGTAVAAARIPRRSTDPKSNPSSLGCCVSSENRSSRIGAYGVTEGICEKIGF